MDLNSSAPKDFPFGRQHSLPVMCHAFVMLAPRNFLVITSSGGYSNVSTNHMNAPLGIRDLWFRRTGCVHSANTSRLGCFSAWKPGLFYRGRTYGHSSCLCVLLTELNPFSSRRIGIEKDSSPFLFLFLFWVQVQKHATLHRYAPIISASVATIIASLKSDHNRLSFSSADSTELVESPSSSSISSRGVGDGGGFTVS
jgi:hypothetical protein